MQGMIVCLLLVIAWRVGKIEKRAREGLPTEKEKDSEWAQKDLWATGRHTVRGMNRKARNEGEIIYLTSRTH
jgi:hypothetical protein